ncbi:DNA integrity scanning protein DisA nucleotide-binding domain protein [Hymenobacter weizhouensis]|uniref:DNA integrity scanning protein DisA nucleotide-binding domain protein n=1 Tax=Hymenobacter sp. YIM 151500-1 TaxID=2987689 RepID=UPI002227A862|nr:DNA integrity scanning protein DisA nucleotide-binding domain protein [Hymenobacter sp. YIM 151500-1]UYZ62955.1 DNA integrity scanning protein DisA nucleotide-binding domain protein [Hymenobacter sp. YIM 151500-1]
MLSQLPLVSAPPVGFGTPLPLPDTFTIWPYQARFRQAAQAVASGIFEVLDEDLDPYVLLLALPADAEDDTTEPAVICLEPTDCGLDGLSFEQVVERGRFLQLTETWQPLERELMSEEMVRRKQHGVGLRRAVQEALDGLDKRGHKRLSFAGWPIKIDRHFVVPVLQLNRKAFLSYPTLHPNRFYTDGRPVAHSLLLAAVLRFHEECVKSLTEPEPGSGLLVRPRDTDELIRAAGKLFLDTPAQDLGMNPATAKLFATCNTISSLRYEGAEGVGKLLLARRGHPNLAEVFALTCPTPLTDYRAVRKLLEMTTQDVSLLADGENVYALGRQVGQYDASREDLFVINFVTHYAWEFQHGGQVLMRAHYGQPSLPRTRLNRTRFRKDLRQTFQLTDPAKVERLWDVVVEASRQKHGTLLVITTEALAEADRLKLQCTLIEPVPLTPLITRLVTAIDGAVLLDPDSYCYSIGVILDGKASGHGTSTRGARYNSAIRYVDSSPYPCMAIVVSEDGLVDVITKESLREE